ncbi:lytic transglycosylase domain-containing protein [Aureimonas leprariae]|uniref:Lytic transglycosylase domain-containing protein n=1 Tax=Plantimonas leprariae TaxID=2615207 RepID=A0A7V7TVB1_9HYPH|nr:lytic transglycosylase domain-containing protein [Aureimonas leprariae]KAB0677528.1 lytic transglycosylase domain-containing protein [Aureimonas leprariae]
MLRTPVVFGLALIVAVAAGGVCRADETSRAFICSMIDGAAARHALPAAFLTRLIWRESSFRSGVRSRAGAQGIAQFTPATAGERGLVDPFDPEAAIPASASYLADLKGRFGSLELAAAAYNAGPNRIARWRNGQASLPDETRAHVRFITGTDLAAPDDDASTQPDPLVADCLTTLASLRVEDAPSSGGALAEATLPWGVQLVAGPRKAKALQDYAILQRQYASVLADHDPTVIATRLGGRGNRSYYRIRIAFERRTSADGLCRQMRKAGAACLTVRN